MWLSIVCTTEFVQGLSRFATWLRRSSVINALWPIIDTLLQCFLCYYCWYVHADTCIHMHNACMCVYSAYMYMHLCVVLVLVWMELHGCACVDLPAFCLFWIARACITYRSMESCNCLLCSCQLWSCPQSSWKWSAKGLWYNIWIHSDLHLWPRVYPWRRQQTYLHGQWTVEWEDTNLQWYAGTVCNQMTLNLLTVISCFVIRFSTIDNTWALSPLEWCCYSVKTVE